MSNIRLYYDLTPDIIPILFQVVYSRGTCTLHVLCLKESRIFYCSYTCTRTTPPLSCICAHNATRFLFTRFDSHMALMAQSLSRGVSETIKLYIYHTITRISSSTNFLQINLSSQIMNCYSIQYT